MPIYAVAMFFVKEDSTPTGKVTRERLEHKQIEAINMEEALGVAIRYSQHMKDGYGLFYHHTLEIEASKPEQVEP